jgi:2-dehydropantoate 2-reductase
VSPEVLVVGPGALGSLFAARLALAGRAVTLLDHRADRAARLAASGLELSGPGDDAPRAARVGCVTDASGLDPRLVFLCVKVGATRAALEALQPLAGAPPVVVFQNGLARPEAVAEALGDPSRVVGALTSEGATLLGEGCVRHAGRGTTRVGALVEGGDAAAALAQAWLSGAGFAVEEVEDVVRAGWEKLQVNAAINALTGLLQVPNGELLQGAARGVAQAAAEEVGQVAAAKGVAGDWGPAAARARWEAVSRATTLNISSTLQDLRLGRKTEVRAINGAVATAARELGLEAPVNALLAQLVEALEEVGPRQGAVDAEPA